MADKSHCYFITGQHREVRREKIKRKYNKRAVQAMLNTKGEEYNQSLETRAVCICFVVRNTGSNN